MKRVLALCLMLVMVVTLAACGGNAKKIKYFDENKAIPTPDSFFEKIQYDSVKSGVHSSGQTYHIYRFDTADYDEIADMAASYLKTLSDDYGIVLKEGKKLEGFDSVLQVDMYKNSDYIGRECFYSEDGYAYLLFIIFPAE